MRIVVAGGRGQIGRLLSADLAEAGHHVLATVRSTDQEDEVRREGVEPVVVDVTGDVGEQLAASGVDTADAVVYCVGSGAGSGAEKKRTVDRDGSDKLVAWAEAAGVPRYVIVSSHGAHDPSMASGDFVAYLEAKQEADATVQASNLNWTVVRPHSLTDDEPTGRFATPPAQADSSSITRADVAAFLAGAVARDDLAGVTTELINGDQELEQVLNGLSGA